MEDEPFSQACLHRMGTAGVTNHGKFEFRFNRVIPGSRFPNERCLQKQEEIAEFCKRHYKEQRNEHLLCPAGIITNRSEDLFRYYRLQPSRRVDCWQSVDFSPLECDEDLFANRPRQRCAELLPYAGLPSLANGDVFQFSMVQPTFSSPARGNFECQIANHSQQVDAARENLLQFNSRAFPTLNPPPTPTTRFPMHGDCCSGCPDYC